MLWTYVPFHQEIKSHLCCGSTWNRRSRGLAAYPVARFAMGLAPAGFTVYMIPFFISTLAGSILAYVLLRIFEKSQVLDTVMR